MKESHRGNEADGGDEGFLSRWSRRKREASTVPVEPEENAIPEVAEQTPVEEVYHPTDEDMPPLESLDENSDYTGFMSPRVSDELRRLALRKLFHSSSFNVVDGLNDYDQDFTKFEKLGDIITSDMKYHARREAEKRAREALANGESSQEDLEAVSADAQPEGASAEAAPEAAALDTAESAETTQQPDVAPVNQAVYVDEENDSETEI